jgi:hypothetical protein
MTEDEIIALIRRGIREPKPKYVGDDDILDSIDTSINIIGQRLLANEPEYFKKRVSINSDTNIFAIPSACDRILRIWDLGENAFSVSGAADNGSGLVRITTSAVHGLASGDVVTIHDIVGTTEANGTFQATLVDTTNIDLVGSTYSNGYTSGGKLFKEDADLVVVSRASSSEALATETYKWYLDGSNVVIDDPDYTYDLIMNYRYVPSTIAEVPSKFHFGIVSYGVIDLITIPSNDDSDYRDLKNSYDRHARLWELAYSMFDDFAISKESISLSDVARIKRRI